MVAKGLDFDNVTLVGVLAADQSLYVDHYRAAERTFVLLTQVVGRAGRGNKAGRAIIQTYTPENEVLRNAAAQDYDSFYQREISLRRIRREPPFADEVVLTVIGPEEANVRRACTQVRDGLRRAVSQVPYAGMDLEVLGPGTGQRCQGEQSLPLPHHGGWKMHRAGAEAAGGLHEGICQEKGKPYTAYFCRVQSYELNARWRMNYGTAKDRSAGRRVFDQGLPPGY